MAWIIKGQSGFKTGTTPWAMDATSRSFMDLNISGCVLQFQSLANDTLAWTAEASDATGAGTIVPDMGQIVELWWDTTRKFRGHVTGIKVGMKQIAITIDGPWWWMDRTNLTSDVLPYVGAPSGASATRNTFVFIQQSLATSITALMGVGVANGVPISAGSVDAMYTVPQMTLTEQSISNALATLMAWCPDSVAWFDYSGASLPVLNVSRRSGMATTTYTLASDAVEIGDISPRMDLEVARNEINYMTRDATTGKPAWASQVSGSDPGGKRQIVTVSGPEIVQFLPKDSFETYTVQTAASFVDSVAIAGLDATLKNINLLPGGITSSLTTYVSNPNGGTIRVALQTNFAPLTILNSSGGAVPGLAGKKMLLTVAPPDWAVKVLNCIPVRITGTWVTFNKTGSYTPAEKSLQTGGFGMYLGWFSSAPGNTDGVYASGRQFDVAGYLVDPTYVTPTVIYKPWEYTFAVPPAGLAAALVAAQAWVPWEGPITLVADECSGNNLLPYKYNLGNALPACASMAALAKGVSHDLFRGRTVVDLGAPARVDFGTLVGKVRSEPQDNIIYL